MKGNSVTQYGKARYVLIFLQQVTQLVMETLKQ